ncbi:MAG: hypothetical protein IJT70_07485 [Clostridia bacterium]|nr:hypothetical protein [Clostridia bacterium]
MKKILSVLFVFAMLASCMATGVFAEDDLPFELVAPANVSVKWLEGNDSPTTMGMAYGLSNDMTKFFKEKEKAAIEGTVDDLLAKYGIDDIWLTTQIDWAIDDVEDEVSGWHYTKYWDGIQNYGLGYDDEGNCRVSDWDAVDYGIGNATETVNNHWFLRGVTEDTFNGNPDSKTPGIKDQLRPDQYKYDEEDGISIDFDEHTAYFRIRFVLVTHKDTDEGTILKYYYSDWSDTVAVGKEGEKFEPLTEKDIAAPVITDLRMTDEEFNDCPVVAYTLTVPDDLAANATKLEANGGGIYIETYARVKGDTEWIQMQNADWIIKAGEMECPLIHLVNEEHPVIDKDSEIELRCRYRCSQSELDDIFSDYSEIVTFATDEFGGAESAPDTKAPEVISPAPENDDKCPICHFCPRPLGLCIFIWLAIVIVIVIVVIIIVKSKKKKENK